MTPQLYIKLSSQIARQTPEAESLEAQALALQPGIDSAQAWADSCQASHDAAQAALTEAQAVEGAATTAQQDAVSAASTTLESAKTDLAKAKAPQDDAMAHAKQIRAAIAQCHEALDAGGLTLTEQEAAEYALTQDRATVWARIKWHRDMCKAEGVKVGDKWFHSDVDSRIQQMGLVMMGANVPPVPWKTMDGSFVTMTPTLAGQIFAATAARDMAVFAAAEQHRAAVNASADPLAYSFTATGWPAGYVG